MSSSYPSLSQPLATPSISSHDGTNGYELWKSDGTASGTVMVKDINSGSSSSSPQPHSRWQHPLFPAYDGTNGDELWKSDGTASGTVMVKDINSGSGQQFSLLPHSRWQHPLFPSQRRNQRIRIVEERRNCLMAR